MRYKESSGMTPWSSSFKQEFGFGSGFSGEEVYVGSKVDWEGICGEDISEK
jgi:hypothetical protein